MVEHREGAATLFAALGDDRRAWLVTLLAQGDRTVSQLAEQLPITLQGTLKHLRVLEEAGVVSRHKTGRTVTVHLEAERLAEAEAWLARTRSFWSDRLADLSRSFEESP